MNWENYGYVDFYNICWYNEFAQWFELWDYLTDRNINGLINKQILKFLGC